MEYVPSRSLHELVHDRGSLPWPEVAALGAQVAAGLAAAHAAGIVHRDMKPGNVLVTADGTAKVSDFGISHAFDDITVTATGILVGTPAYLAPEVARGAAPDFASDVCALGATLYMAVEGRPPFGTEDNPIAVVHRVATGQWDEPTRAGELAPMLARMMALDPRDRPTMTEVAGRLRALHRAPASAQPTRELSPPQAASRRPALPPMYPPGAPAGEPHPRRRRVAALPLLAAVLVVALGGIIGWTLLSGSGGHPTKRAAANRPASTAHGPAGSPVKHSAGASSDGSTAAAPGRPTAQQLAGAITHYFQIVPGDLNAGWALLTPHFQVTKARSWSGYQGFWNTVDHVDVTSVAGQPPRTATAHLVHYYKNGQVVSQTTTFTLLRRDGVLKIDAET
jgi:hypothetical protein